MTTPPANYSDLRALFINCTLPTFSCWRDQSGSGANSSVTKKVHERLYGGSHLLNDQGHYRCYGRVADCFITGNEHDIKHCVDNVLSRSRATPSSRCRARPYPAPRSSQTACAATAVGESATRPPATS
jgi:hypothetical protein